MKILFNTDQFFLHGGIEKTIATRANYFANLPDVEVYIVTTEQRDNSLCYPLDKKIKCIDLNVNYDRSKSYFSFGNIRKALNHLRAQKNAFEKIKPDVVISPNFNFDHYWLPFISRAKTIKERHGSRFFEEEFRKNANFFSRIRFSFNDWLDGKYSHVVVLNKDEKKYVRSQNVVVIPNSVSIPDHHANLSSKKVLAAGRLAPVKAFDELIKAWRIVNESCPDWELHIFGEDYLDTKQSLLQLIHQLDLANVIHIKNSVDDLPKTMIEYSIYAMSSITECFPMVLLEAQSVGLPIVSYDCPNGPRNIIANKKDGLLAEYKNFADLASQIISLIQNDSKRYEMGKNAKENVQRFETASVMQLWYNLLNLPNV